jgi:hypothetical protein
LATSFLERQCYVGYAELLSKLGPSMDAIIRRCLGALAEKVVGLTMDGLYHVCFVDLSKLGRVSQQNINECMQYARNVLERNPQKSVLVLIPPLLPSAGTFGLRGESRHAAETI